ncbi:DUF6233 domain-containing protein [Streptomyces phaeochromogenes]|uniref:DUF6233 domain-containing protein n=1 Tax=Streptomyces phaeochromogenes TaxID=1923 RepID=UPI0033FFB2A4
MWLQRIDDKIAALQKREAEQQHGRLVRLRCRSGSFELGIGDGRPPAEVRMGGCYAAAKRRCTVGRDEARWLLATGVRTLSHCQPDAALDILDLPTRPALPATAH